MKRNLLILILVLLNIACDQISKTMIRNNLDTNEVLYFFNDNLILKNIGNPGAIMGVGANLTDIAKTIYFKILPFIFLLYLLRMILTKPAISKKAAVGLSLAVGGGFGNLFDRIFLGEVTDFIVVNIGFLKHGIFNIADVSIIIGLTLLFIEILFNKDNNLYESLA